MSSPTRERPEESAKILKAIEEVGFQPTHFARLGIEYEKYGPAIPVLIDHLQRRYSPYTKFLISLLLQTRDSKPYRTQLISLLKSPALQPLSDDPYESDVLFQLAEAIGKTTDESNLQETIALALDRNVASRQGFLRELRRRRRHPLVKQALPVLAEDSLLAHAIATWK